MAAVWSKNGCNQPTHHISAGPSHKDFQTVQDLPHIQYNPQVQDDAANPPFPLLELPDELLVKILELAIPPPCPNLYPATSGSLYDTDAIAALVHTCRRFYRLVTPFYYYRLNFIKIYYGTSLKIIKRLLCTISKEPSLGRHCRQFAVDIRDFTTSASTATQAENFETLNQLICTLTNVKSLTIHGGFGEMDNEQTWSAIQSCANSMPSLEDVHLSGQGSSGPDLVKVVKYLQAPLLRVLTLHGVGGTIAFSKDDMKDVKQTAITSISLSDFNESPAALIYLVNDWPKMLAEFRFGKFYQRPYLMNLKLFGAMLYRHRNTLKVLEIGILCRRGSKPFFDLSDFTALEHLIMSRWYKGSPPIKLTEQVAQYFFAPNLGKFTWDFSIFDQHSGICEAFGQLEEEWLRSMANTAIARNTSLKEIYIDYKLTLGAQSLLDEYPWDRMDRLVDEFEPKGIKIRYFEPTISRSDWLADVLV